MNPWNQLTGVFHDAQKLEQIPEVAADTILLAYPPMLDLIDRIHPSGVDLTALDLGCGTGHFCKELHVRGFEVTGVDPSDGMIDIARRHVPAEVRLLHGDIEATPAQPLYDLITSAMVFHFVEDMENLSAQIDRRLKPGGLLVFAVFNPPFVKDLLRAGITFKDFDSLELPVEGHMELVPGVRIPVFIRRTADYDDLFLPRGYTRCLELRPPFTEAFLKKHPVNYPTQDPEFLVLGFEKKSQAPDEAPFTPAPARASAAR